MKLITCDKFIYVVSCCHCIFGGNLSLWKSKRRSGLESESEIDEGFSNSGCTSEASDVSAGGSLYENGESGAGSMSDGYSG